MLEGISDSFYSFCDSLYEAAQGVYSFTGRIFSAAYASIANIGSLFAGSSQNPKTLVGRVEEPKEHRTTLDEALSVYVNTLSLAPYISKGSNFQIVSILNEACKMEDCIMYFIEGKFDFEDKSLNAMFSMKVDEKSRICKGFDINYITNGPLFSPQLFMDIVRGVSTLLPESLQYINSQDSLTYIKTEEYERRKELVWTFSKGEKTLSFAITLQDEDGKTSFVIHDPRNQMSSAIKI